MDKLVLILVTVSITAYSFQLYTMLPEWYIKQMFKLRQSNKKIKRIERALGEMRVSEEQPEDLDSKKRKEDYNKSPQQNENKRQKSK